MNVKMPTDVSRILNVLHDHGYEAYAVGGCIRDSVLGRIPDDWDITTSATPYQVKELFDRTIDTGLIHGTVTIMMGHNGYEVTTYRIDGEYEDGRHPKEVAFTSSLTEDLKRRDFTINAMACSEESGIVDKFDGMGDLERKIIRCVGDPMLRFGEDALRMLRAVRFAAQLGFEIEENTRSSIWKMAANLSKISSERIQVEIVKLLVSKRPGMWRLAYDTGITAVIMPEFDKMMDGNNRECCGEVTLKAMENTRQDKVLRLTMLFEHMGQAAYETDCNKTDGLDTEGSKMAKKILRRLKFDNDTIDQVTKLVLWHGYELQPDAAAIRHVIHRMGENLFPMILEIWRGNVLAEDKDPQKLERLDRIETIYHKITEDGDCVSLKTLAVTGKDLIAAGVRPGPDMGRILNEMLQLVLDDPAKNRKELLLSMIHVSE